MKNRSFLIITDARKPQVSGVITVLEKLVSGIKKLWHEVVVINPSMFKTVPLPTYKEIELSLVTNWKVKKIIKKVKPDFIHIATEWPLWVAWILACRELWLKYTTAYHTKFPEYVNLRIKIPINWSYKALKLFHKNSSKILVSTHTMKKELEKKGFKNLRVYPLWVDSEKFKMREDICLNLERPVFCYMWRVAIEKNIEDFLDLKLPWSKLVIWDWPSKKDLEDKYKDVKFVWYQKWKNLVNFLSASDVFVFPSKTDTFWLAILEAMACWLPVAAYDVLWPKDIITSWFDWFVWENLKQSALECLNIPKENPLKTACKYNWSNMVEKFIAYQVINKKKKWKKSLIRKIMNLS